MERKKRGGRFFIGIVVIEHIVFALLMALAIAPKSPPRPKESAINVEFVKTETPRKKIKAEIPVAIPDVRQNQPSETLPQIQPTTNLSEYLTANQTEGGLPKLRRTQASSENPERLSLGAPPSKGRSKGDFWMNPTLWFVANRWTLKQGITGAIAIGDCRSAMRAVLLQVRAERRSRVGSLRADCRVSRPI